MCASTRDFLVDVSLVVMSVGFSIVESHRSSLYTPGWGRLGLRSQHPTAITDH